MNFVQLFHLIENVPTVQIEIMHTVPIEIDPR